MVSYGPSLCIECSGPSRRARIIETLHATYRRSESGGVLRRVLADWQHRPLCATRVVGTTLVLHHTCAHIPKRLLAQLAKPFVHSSAAAHLQSYLYDAATL